MSQPCPKLEILRLLLTSQSSFRLLTNIAKSHKSNLTILFVADCLRPFTQTLAAKPAEFTTI